VASLGLPWYPYRISLGHAQAHAEDLRAFRRARWRRLALETAAAGALPLVADQRGVCR
jgi:hypothetical protein